MHAISSYRGNKPQTNKHTDRGDYITLRRSLACSVIKSSIITEAQLSQNKVQLVSVGSHHCHLGPSSFQRQQFTLTLISTLPSAATA